MSHSLCWREDQDPCDPLPCLRRGEPLGHDRGAEELHVHPREPGHGDDEGVFPGRVQV